MNEKSQENWDSYITNISVYFNRCIGKKYYTEEWKISSQEIYDEVFHQYTEYILKVVDSYDLEYIFEIKNSEVDKATKRIGSGINILFNNKCKITVRFSTDLKSGSITSRIYFNTKTREETYQINRDYFKMLHEINLFSVQGLQGNNYAFEMFLQEAKDSKMQENTYNGRYFYYIEESLDYHGYSLNLVKPSKESNYWRAEYHFSGMLLDKNIIFNNLYITLLALKYHFPFLIACFLFQVRLIFFLNLFYYLMP